MDWQEQLITIYLWVCKHYRESLWSYCERRSNYANLSFSDAEVITIYLFGIIDGKEKYSDIYKYTDRHLRAWFPRLPSYVAFIQRLNRLEDVFAPLLAAVVAQREEGDTEAVWLTDSFPVALARQGHRFKAKVAPQIATAGYCATKKLYFYGIRVHVVARAQTGTLPLPVYIGITGANDNDGKVFDQIRPQLHDLCLCADKAYQRPDQEHIKQEQGLVVLMPVKKTKGQKHLEPADKEFSTAVSRLRQPIESLFAWIEQKSGIQHASRVRSYAGLMAHVFGRLAAAFFFWKYLRV